MWIGVEFPVIKQKDLTILSYSNIQTLDHT